MRLGVIDNRLESPEVPIEGTLEDCRIELLHKFRWLAHKYGLHAPLDVLLTALRQTSGVQVKHYGVDMAKSGHDSDVVPLTPQGAEFARLVAQAIREDSIKPIVLSGKHSKGALLARADGAAILLKPGS